MKTFKGTQGKWLISDEVDENMYIQDQVGNKIASVSDGNFDLDIIHMDVVKSNAQLIASAPEILSALQFVKQVLDSKDYNPNFDKLDSVVTDAINKALGE